MLLFHKQLSMNTWILMQLKAFLNPVLIQKEYKSSYFSLMFFQPIKWVI